MSGCWFIAAWLDEDDDILSSEVRGRFETTSLREEAMEELKNDETDGERIVIIPINVLGDDDATLEVGEL